MALNPCRCGKTVTAGSFEHKYPGLTARCHYIQHTDKSAFTAECGPIESDWIDLDHRETAMHAAWNAGGTWRQ